MCSFVGAKVFYREQAVCELEDWLSIHFLSCCLLHVCSAVLSMICFYNVYVVVVIFDIKCMQHLFSNALIYDRNLFSVVHCVFQFGLCWSYLVM